MHESEIISAGIALDMDETLAATNRFWIQELAKRFGNPDNLSADEIIARYRYTQNIPFWQSAEALAWMEEARNSDEIQTALPLIENANQVVTRLNEIVPIAAYITARPQQVRNGSLEWLAQHGFPTAPLIMRPKDLDYTEGNKWKAELLASLYPSVWAIIDDNEGLLPHLPDDYQGTVFLYDHAESPAKNLNVVAVKKWEDMLSAVSERYRQRGD